MYARKLLFTGVTRSQWGEGEEEEEDSDRKRERERRLKLSPGYGEREKNEINFSFVLLCSVVSIKQNYPSLTLHWGEYFYCVCTKNLDTSERGRERGRGQ